MDYIEEAKALVRNLDQRMGPSPYDIAWLARLPSNGGAHWPDLLDWLLENQHQDGSWGSEILYYHDRIICTLAAILALHANGHTPQARQAIKRAERYLWHHLHFLPRDPFELVGFELVAPTLLAEAYAAGLDVPTHTCGYGEIQTAKLRLIPPDMLYSPRISTIHSLEFLGRSGRPDLIHASIASNGSLGNSPATTAYYLLFHYGDDKRAWSYLEQVRKHQREVIYLYPFSIFELSWVLNNLQLSRLPVTEFAGPEVWEKLNAHMTPQGIGLDPTFGIPDGDITSVCTRLLLSAGIDVSPDILARFENKATRLFRTYEFERNFSIGTNIHALEALMVMPDYPDYRKVREQISLMLLDSRQYKMYWIDKWHASPYYATAHALIGLLREGTYLLSACHNTVEWLLHTQRDDGSWGFFDRGTAEETAYTLMALLFFAQYEPADPDILHRAAAFLESSYHGPDTTYPELWVGKCLYTPYDVVRSAILSALILYQQTFGRSP